MAEFNEEQSQRIRELRALIDGLEEDYIYIRNEDPKDDDEWSKIKIEFQRRLEKSQKELRELIIRI